MRSTSSSTRPARAAQSGKLSPTERSALNQALAKALAFRDAGKMPKAREWAAELVRLLKSHDPFYVTPPHHSGPPTACAGHKKAVDLTGRLDRWGVASPYKEAGPRMEPAK